MMTHDVMRTMAGELAPNVDLEAPFTNNPDAELAALLEALHQHESFVALRKGNTSYFTDNTGHKKLRKCAVILTQRLNALRYRLLVPATREQIDAAGRNSTRLLKLATRLTQQSEEANAWTTTALRVLDERMKDAVDQGRKKDRNIKKLQALRKGKEWKALLVRAEAKSASP